MGEVHAAQVPPLPYLHWKVQGPGVQVNSKVAVVELVGLAGAEVMVVSGGLAATVQVYEAGVGSVLLKISVARTWKVWLASVKAR